MAKQVQFRRGTTAQHSTFTGALAEITVDTDKKVAVIHDGTTAGGFPLARADGVVATATKLATTRTINGISFDGSENIIITDSTKLPLSGGTMTGPVSSLRGNYIALSTNNIDLSLGDVFSKSISSATTFTLSNIPTSGQTFGFFLEITNNNGSVIWWSGINWDSKTTPTLTAVGSDIFSFYTYDGGVTWKGAVHSRNVG